MNMMPGKSPDPYGFLSQKRVEMGLVGLHLRPPDCIDRDIGRLVRAMRAARGGMAPRVRCGSLPVVWGMRCGRIDLGHESILDKMRSGNHRAASRPFRASYRSRFAFCFFRALRSCSSLRSNCSRAICRPIRRASERMAASARGEITPCSAEGAMTSIPILFRFCAIARKTPMPIRGRDIQDRLFRTRIVLRRMRAVIGIVWRRNGRGAGSAFPCPDLTAIARCAVAVA